MKMRSKSPKVGAIVINYHKADLTKVCLESLAGQVQMICLIDNSAECNEFSRMQKHVEELRFKWPDLKIELLNPGVNLGFGNGVQYGLDYSEIKNNVDAILIINNDAVAHENMVELLLTALIRCGYRAVVAPKASESSVPGVFWYHRLSAALLNRPFPGAFKCFSGACLMVPSFITEPRLFAPEFFLYGDDIELSWRLHRSGIPLVFVPEAVFEHKGSATNVHGGELYEYYTVRMHILLAFSLAKNSYEAALFLLVRMISLPVRALKRSFQQKGFVPIRAVINAFRGNGP